MKRSTRVKKRALAKIKKIITDVLLLVPVLLLLLAPHLLYGQSARAPREIPPVGAQLVREGDFAAALEAALGVGNGRDEIEAENRLASLGILPRNGWMADYPVTPDIVGELQEALGNAAVSGKLSMGRDEALRRFDGVTVGAGLLERPYASSGTYGPDPGSVEGYPDQGVVSGYYADQGPPVVTYYAPPPDYYYLYSFVPYPFWYSTSWFPGFFVLRDFHRPYRYGFVSNHYRPVTNSAYTRVDPVTRVHGGTFASANAARAGGFVHTTTIVRGNTSSSVPVGVPRTVSPGVSRAIAPRAGFARTAVPFAGAPGNAVRSFGPPHATTAGFSRPASSMSHSSFGSSSFSHSSFAHSGSSHSGSGARSGGGRSGGRSGGGGHR
jgi:hypothetical protein